MWATDFGPKTLPPQWWQISYLSLQLVQIASTSLASTPLSPGSPVWRRQWCRSSCGWGTPWECRRRPPFCRTGQTEEITSLMGSTSFATSTSWAFWFSTKVVTVLTPARRTGGLWVGTSPLLPTFFSAQANNLCCFSCFVSGLCLWASLRSWIAVWRSKTWVNYLIQEAFSGTYRQ